MVLDLNVTKWGGGGGGRQPVRFDPVGGGGGGGGGAAAPPLDVHLTPLKGYLLNPSS